MNLKWLHEFNLNKETEVEETEVTKNEQGEEIKVTKKVKKMVPIKFKILKPNRRLHEQAELTYAIKLSECVKAGLLTKSLLSKRYQNDGGAMSEPEKTEYTKLYLELFKLESDYERLLLKDKRTEEDNENLEKLLFGLANARRQIQQIEYNQSTLFDQTAENKARNHVIMWWILNLSYQELEDNKVEPLFGIGSVEERLVKYDEVEEANDEFMLKAIRKLTYLLSFWYMGRANSSEEFKKVEEFYDKEHLNKEKGE
jgi:hypothetical protein